MGVPTLILARTDADAARLVTSDVDERDRPFLTGERTAEGFYRMTSGPDCAIARAYRQRGMAAYSVLRQAEFAAQDMGYTAVRHQREVGTGYFDAVSNAVAGGLSSTTALAGSTEAAQF